MDFPITITRKKIKNLYLRVHADGRVTVSAPKRCSDKVIREFVNSKSDWIMTQLEKLECRQTEHPIPANTLYETGEIHEYRGCACTLIVEETGGRGRVSFREELDKKVLLMYAPKGSSAEQRKALLEGFYREQLKAVIPELLENYVRIVGKAPTDWRIRNMKTRWGTCNVQSGRIWLSLHLAKKPLQCLEYVIAHELTHLHVPNHSKAFWERMDVYYPNWREVRNLLKEN